MNDHHPRILRRAAIAALLVLGLLPATAFAHQWLRGSAPAEGEEVTVVPDSVRLDFSEPVRIEFTELTLEGPEGAIALGTPAVAADDPSRLSAAVEGRWAPGEFILRWRTVGADGHRTDGAVAFSVAEGAEGLPQPEPDDPVEEEPQPEVGPPHHDPGVFPDSPGFGAESPGYAAIRAVFFVSLVVLLGAVALRLVVLPVTAQRRRAEADALRPAIDRGAARLGLAAALVLALAALARLWAQSASLFGPGEAFTPDHLGATLSMQPWATGWWLQAAAVALAIVGFSLVRRRPRFGWALAASGALLAAVTPALSGHAVASPGTAWLAVPADALHVLAAGGWVGGLLALLVVGIPAALRLDPGRRGRGVSALVHGFSPTALLFAGVLVGTGLIAAWIHVGEIEALWTSAYGRTLLLKLAIFAGVFLVGAYNFLHVRPALGEDEGTGRLRRSATVELVLALAVLVVTAVLVATPPPGG